MRLIRRSKYHSMMFQVRPFRRIVLNSSTKMTYYPDADSHFYLRILLPPPIERFKVVLRPHDRLPFPSTPCSDFLLSSLLSKLHTKSASHRITLSVGKHAHGRKIIKNCEKFFTRFTTFQLDFIYIRLQPMKKLSSPVEKSKHEHKRSTRT